MSTKRTLFYIFFSLSLLFQVRGDSISSSPKDTIGWEVADSLMKSRDYKTAAEAYAAVNDNLVEVYKDINSRQVEDLRQTYSIDTVQLERNLANQGYQKMILIAIASTILIALLAAILIDRQNKQLISSRKALQAAKEQIELSIQNKSIFLSNMSHEIRTPLNALIGFSDLLSMSETDEETRLQCNSVIKQNSDLLLRLINDVIDISCLDALQMEFKLERCNLIELSRNVVQTLSTIKQSSTEILFETNLKELYIHTDVDRLQQVIINLMTNAIKFTKEGIITLRLEKKNKESIQFSVSDTGCGIPVEQQSKLFTRFKKVHKDKQGTGLGLSICKLIINNLGGTIWIDPHYVTGARFCFTHPIKS